MDVERILHHKRFRTSIVVAGVLSVLIIIAFTLVGRGTLKLQGALTLAEPTDVTVIAVVEPKLERKSSITNIEFIRKEPSPNPESGRLAYSYVVTLSTGDTYLTRIDWDDKGSTWELITFEKLHPGQ